MEECVEPFLGWLQANGVDLDSFPVSLRYDLAEGCGLVATRNLAKEEEFIRIPQSLIISGATADEAGLLEIKADPIQVRSSVPSLSSTYHPSRRWSL